MESKEAFKILTEGLEIANKNGVYSLAYSAMIYKALLVMGQSLIPVNVKERASNVSVEKVTKEKK